MTDLPLHVRVAQALGWTDVLHIPIEELNEHDHWTGKPPEGWPGPFPSIVSGIDMKERVVVHMATIPRFHDDWAVTGPLIERYQMCLEPAGTASGGWFAQIQHPKQLALSAVADAPLVAVCKAILKLPKDPHA